MDFEKAKFNLVEQQIRTWNVLNPVLLETLSSVPREKFVPEKYRGMAFADMNIPIGDGQVMIQPNVEARMLQALDPLQHEVVLEIGSGTGYTAALLAHHARRVETVEIRPEFVSLAQNNLSEVGIVNVSVHQGDAARGWGTDVEYDCILFSGSVSEIPVQYKKSLVVGGRLAAIVGKDPIMNAVLVKRIGATTWEMTYLFETLLPPLDNFQSRPEFVF